GRGHRHLSGHRPLAFRSGALRHPAAREDLPPRVKVLPRRGVRSVDIVCAPPWPDVAPPTAIVVKSQTQTPDAFMQSLVGRLHASLWPLLQAQVGKTLDVMADFDKTLKAQFEVEFKDTVFID